MNSQTGVSLATETSWPDAVLGASGIALVGTVVVVLLWHLLMAFRIWVTSKTANGKTAREYRQLAEDTSRELHEINRRLTDGGKTPEGDPS